MKFSTALIYVCLFIAGVSLFTYLDFKDTSLLYDDVYSISMAKASYADILNITASDVHPPLYYWCLKLFSSLFGDSLFCFRIFSTLGIIAVLLLGCFPIRRLFGDKTAITFMLLIIIFPVTQYLATEIRMYSWTMFFVLACALSAYQAFKKGGRMCWGVFLVTGLCAAYFHNYGLLSVFGIYILFFIILIRAKKKLTYLILCGVLFSIVYLPWLIQLWGQVDAVSSGYWIKPLTLNDLFLHIYYFYSPKEIWQPFTYFSKLQMMTGLIVLMAIQLVLTIKVLLSDNIKKDKMPLLAIISFITFLFPVAIGFIISVTYLPVLVTRYMTCSFGLFILSLALILAKALEFPRYRRLSYAFLLLLLITGGVRLYSGVNYYNRTGSAYQSIRDFIKGGDRTRTTLVVNDFSYHVMPRLQLIVPENEYIILTGERTEDFRPFRFDEIRLEDFVAADFILVHQDREAIQHDFRQYRESLTNHYIAIDSLHATDIRLYHMKKVTP
ncbi:hypothetical protein JCM30204_14110 [Dysgonomonas termitidis]